MVKRIYAHLGDVDTAPRSSRDRGRAATSSGWGIGCSGWGWRGRLLWGMLLPAGEQRARETPPRPEVEEGKSFQRAGDRTRTGDVQLGKLAFYH